MEIKLEVSNGETPLWLNVWLYWLKSSHDSCQWKTEHHIYLDPAYNKYGRNIEEKSQLPQN